MINPSAKRRASRRFNTNNKTKVSFTIDWEHFCGASQIANPPASDLVEAWPGLLKIHNKLGSNQLYDRLNDLVFGPWGDAMEEEFVFARLPHESYHLTVKDGVNVDNLHLLKESAAQALRQLFAGLPQSILTPTSALPTYESTCFNSPIRFRFTGLSIWNRSPLVARVEPFDEESRSLANMIEQSRSELDGEWEKLSGLPRPSNGRWSPHISLGYFPNPEMAAIAESRVDHWSEVFAAQLGDTACSFDSFSLYAFTNMATFVKPKGGK